MVDNQTRTILFLFTCSLVLYACRAGAAPTSDVSQVPQTDLVELITSTAGSITETPRLNKTQAPTLTSIPKPTETSPAAYTATSTSVIIDKANISGIVPLHTLSSHLDSVTDVAFSPDNSLLASSSNDGTVRLWRVSNGSLLFTLEGHEGSVKSMSFSPNGDLLASGSDDRTVRIWRVSDGNLMKVFDTSLVGRAVKVQFSPDGSLLVVGGSTCYLMLRQSSTGILRRTLKQPQCHGNEGGPIDFWGLAFTQDGASLIAGEGRPGGGSGSIYVWDYEGYELPQFLRGYNYYVRDLSLSPDGFTIALALIGSPDIWLLQTQDGTLIDKLEGQTYRINSVAFSPSGLLLASGGRDTTIRLWDPSSGELLHTLENHNEAVNRVAFSPDGTMIASGSDDGEVMIWGLQNP